MCLSDGSDFRWFWLVGCPGLVVGGSGFVFAVEGDWHLSREVPIHQALPFCARYWTASFPRPVTAHVARPWARVAAWSLSSAASHRVVLHILVP